MSTTIDELMNEERDTNFVAEQMLTAYLTSLDMSDEKSEMGTIRRQNIN